MLLVHRSLFNVGHFWSRGGFGTAIINGLLVLEEIIFLDLLLLLSLLLLCLLGEELGDVHSFGDLEAVRHVEWLVKEGIIEVFHLVDILVYEFGSLKSDPLSNSEKMKSKLPLDLNCVFGLCIESP